MSSNIRVPQAPIPGVTPYQAPNYGGNKYIKPGTTGPSVPQNAMPMNKPDGTTQFSNGATYPNSAIQYPKIEPQPKASGSTLGAMTESDAVSRGYDVNQLRAQGLIAEPTSQGAGVEDQTARLRSEIGGAYDAYLRGLDEMVGGFGEQRQAQEGIVNSQYTQGRNTLQGQYDVGMNQLSGKRENARESQAKTLRDLENNVRNMFQAGNVYLGARGAGDSSAANMYSYAVTQMGNKNRGEVMGQTRSIMNDIDGREFELKNTVDTEMRNLEEGKNQKMLEVAQWYNESLNNVLYYF